MQQALRAVPMAVESVIMQLEDGRCSRTRVAINLNRRVANAEPLREHRSGRAQQRVVVVITRTRDMCGQRDERARDRPDMEVVDIRRSPIAMRDVRPIVRPRKIRG